jgi:hypothetical protein
MSASGCPPECYAFTVSSRELNIVSVVGTSRESKMNTMHRHSIGTAYHLAAVLLAIGSDIAAAQGPAATPPTSIACPVSKGSLQVVPPSPHIFGSGAVWFGDGPVYINLAWKSDTLLPARFSFSKIPTYGGQPSPAKTPVVAEPSYAGTVAIRGRALDATSTALMFRGDHGPTDHLELRAPNGRPSAADWSFWATGIIVPQAGCYELRIATAHKSEAIVFEAAR